MKRFLIALLFLIPMISFAQEYTEVVDVPGKTAAQLYASAKEWVALTFKSANNVVQLDDPVGGKLIGKGATVLTETYYSTGLVKIATKLFFNVDFTIAINIKDNKYKVLISDLYVKEHAEIAGDIVAPKQNAFTEYLNQKEYYKTEGDPATAKHKMLRNLNTGYYNIVCKTEDEMKSLMKSLEAKMKKNDENW